MVISFSIHKPTHLHHPLRRHYLETWKYFSRDYKYLQGRLLQGILTQQQLGQDPSRAFCTPLPSPISHIPPSLPVIYRDTKKTAERSQGRWERSLRKERRSLSGVAGPTSGQEVREEDGFCSCQVCQLLPRVEQRLGYLAPKKESQSRAVYCMPAVCWPLLSIVLSGVLCRECFKMRSSPYTYPHHSQSVLCSTLHRVIAEMLISVHCYIPRAWNSVSIW